MNVPLTGWPAAVLPVLHAQVSEAVGDRGLVAFKIGRTNDPAARESAYRQEYDPPLSGLVAAYRTDSVKHALDVEAALITAFRDHPKCLNVADHAGGNVSPDYVQYVYVALWERSTR